MSVWGYLRGHPARPDEDGLTCVDCGERVRRMTTPTVHYRHTQRRVPLAQRLTNVAVGNGNGCWEWQGQRNRSGYGIIGIQGTPKLAHRVSWEVNYGTIPAGRDVCHACDNPPCIRPDHLWLGTRKQNMVDAQLKGRLAGRPGPEFCKRGHPLSGANVYAHSGRRHCRTCRHEYKVDQWANRHRVPELSRAAAERMQEALSG